MLLNHDYLYYIKKCIIIFLILYYIFNYKNYHNYPYTKIFIMSKCIAKKDRFYNFLEKNIPFIEKNNIILSKYINTKFLLNNYYDKIIFIVDSFERIIPTNLPIIKKMKLGDFINDTIINNKNKNYLKSEDEYELLKELNLYNKIIGIIRDNLSISRYTLVLKEQLSFWYGPKDSITSFHYDTDHTNILYMIEGRKKIFLIHPKYEKYMKGSKNIQKGASWSSLSIKEILDHPYIKYESLIVGKYQSINITRYWWHAVINLTSTMAITYHYYTLPYLFCNSLA